MIYVKLMKCPNGTLQVALIFWKNLTGVFKKWGFELNKYGECVSNIEMDGNQCTILRYVDDMKISHINSKVVDGIA